MTAPTVDFYEVLDVAPDATLDDIRAAHKSQVRKTHPDAGGSAALFRLVQEAYETLSDNGRRAAYDQSRAGGTRSSSSEPGPGTPPPEGGGAGARQSSNDRTRPPRGPRAPTSRAVTYGRPDPANPAAASTRTSLERAAWPDHTFVFHHLQTRQRKQVFDHAVLAGNRLLLITVETWGEGAYQHHANETYRDGRHTADATERIDAAARELARQLQWHGPHDLLRVIVPEHPAARLELAGFETARVPTVHIDTFDGVLAAWWASGADGAPHGYVRHANTDILHGLHRLTSDPHEAHLIPACEPGSLELARADTRDPSTPLGRAHVAAAAIGWFTTLAGALWLSSGGPMVTALVVLGAAVSVGSFGSCRAAAIQPPDNALHDLRRAAGMRSFSLPRGPWNRPVGNLVALPVFPAVTAAAVALVASRFGAGDADVVVLFVRALGLATLAAAIPAAVHAIYRANAVLRGRHRAAAATAVVRQALAAPGRRGLVVHALRVHLPHPLTLATLEQLEATSTSGPFASYVRHSR